MLTVGVVSTTSGVPVTVADGLLLSRRPSSVQIAPEELHCAVACSVIVRSPVPAGRTLTLQARSLPCVLRDTRLMLPALTRNAALIFSQPAASSSVNARSNVKSAPVCSSGTFEKLAVSGVPASTATVAEGLLLSWTGLSSSEQMAPWLPQARLPGSVIVTASSPSGSTVISQRSLLPLTREAAVTSPFVAVNAWSRIAAGLIETSLVNATLKVNAVLPSWSCGTFSKLPVRVSVLRMVPSPTESARMS